MSHIFLRDRQQGTTRLLSTAVSGGPASGPSRHPAINADGTSVVFESAATNLIEKGKEGVGSTGIYLIGLSSGVRKRVDARGDGARPSGQSMSPGISADGRFVVFAARADLTCRGAACVDEPRDGNGVTDVYLRDMQTNVLRRISRSAGGNDPDGPATIPRSAATAGSSRSSRRHRT
jgi:Tol biopolymer transport system component